MPLPELTPGGAAEPSSATPPRSFRPLRGTPTRVLWLNERQSNSGGRTEAQKNGLRYEEKVQEFLSLKLGYDYHEQPRLSFRDGSETRIVIPDGIFLRLKRPSVIFEVKSQHMPEAWWQLTQLYVPVFQSFWKRPVMCCEVVKSYDPSMGFPEPVQLCRSLDEVLDDSAASFKVFIWRP